MDWIETTHTHLRTLIAILVAANLSLLGFTEACFGLIGRFRGMETAAVKSEGRKRKRKDGEDEDNNTRRKIVLGLRCVVLVGLYVKKEFEGSGEFLGKIVSYDSGLYRVVYEDGDFEDLETSEAKVLLVGENEMDDSFRERKKLIDQYIFKKHGKKVETVGNDNGVKSVVDDGGKKNSENLPLQPVDQKSINNKSKTGSKKKTKSHKLGLGLIWKKKNVHDTGVEFRVNNILFKGNPNGYLLAPKCYICAQPYNSDFMYILCEKCDNWFHADSVDLQESEILELYGFKCCRCRRIRLPICPYTDPDTRSKEAVEKNQKIKNSEFEPESNLDSFSKTRDAFIKDWKLNSTPDFDVNVQEERGNEHPFCSFPAVGQVNKEKPEADSRPGPKKLPVRRRTKPEKESSSNNNLNSGPIESSTPIVECGVSTDGFADDMMFSVESGLDMVPCRVCSQADPCPDLFCQTCDLWLHQQCSPWEEDSSWEPETGWKCGNCRQWS